MMRGMAAVKDKRPPALAHAEAIRQAQIAAGDERAKGGALTPTQREARAFQKICRLLGTTPEDLEAALSAGASESFKELRPLAMRALAADLTSSNDMVRKAAWNRVLDQTDGRLAKDDDDTVRTVEFYSAALGDERPDPAADDGTFSW